MTSQIVVLATGKQGRDRPISRAGAFRSKRGSPMGRWPDNQRSTIITFLLLFGLFPLLCLLALWFVNR